MRGWTADAAGREGTRENVNALEEEEDEDDMVPRGGEVAAGLLFLLVVVVVEVVVVGIRLVADTAVPPNGGI